MKKILTSIWFLALIVAVPIIVYLPPIFDKYQIELLSKEQKISESKRHYFKDLNGDGKIERIEAYRSHNNLFSFQCFTEENRLIDQYNFPHFYSEHLTSLFFSDFDGDSLIEVTGFTIYKDSLYLNWVEPLDAIPHFHEKFITTINTEQRKTLDARIRQVEFFDFDNDGETEVVFSVEVGYNWFPRKLYVYHPISDSLQMSNNFGSHFANLHAFDHQNDGDFELFCVSSSSRNIPENYVIEYIDDRPRLFVFDKNLDIVFNPIEFPPGLGARVYPFFINDLKGEVNLLYHNYSSENNMSFWKKVGLDGESIFTDTLFLSENLGKRIFVKEENDSNYLVFGMRGLIYRISPELQIVDSINLDFTAEHTLGGSYDIDEDGSSEYYVIDESGEKLLVYFDNFNVNVELQFAEKLQSPYVIASTKQNQFVVFGNMYYYNYQIIRNTFYYLKFPFYLLIYFAVVGFVWLLQYARMRQLHEKLELQNQVRELQLRTLKNQLDPHFIFNTFNTIASVVKQGRNEEAYNVLVQFSKMVRANLDNSQDIYTTLKGELDFVNDYLFIQNFRFKKKVEFNFNIAKNVNTKIRIPKLLIQIHVENALKHGLKQADYQGIITIHVFCEKSNIIIEVSDNGIGREKSKQLKTGGTGIGLKAIQQIIDLNNKNSKSRIQQEIFDLKDETGKPAGTKVILRIEN